MKRVLVLLCGLIISQGIALQADGADAAVRGAVTGRQGFAQINTDVNN